MENFNVKISQVVGVGPKMAQKLAKLGVDSSYDLMYHFPMRYDDFSRITLIEKAKVGQRICIKGTISTIKNQRTFRRRMFLTHVLISDKSDSLKAIFFNQPFLTRILKKGDEYYFLGKIERGKEGFVLQNPLYEKEPSILPIYPETEGITSKYLRKIIKNELLKIKINDFLPEEIKKSQHLINLNEAIKFIHFPAFHEEIKKARQRLAFDELFLIQLKMLKIRQQWQKNRAISIKFHQESIQKLVKKLPFRLTNAQRRSAWEILQDIEKSVPMNRLLEGDVGSGKTVVAAIAMLNTAKNNFQSVILAPTEILAIQHFENISKLLTDFGVRIALLTSGKSDLRTNPPVSEARNQELRIKKPELIKKIKNNEVDIVVGTHSLLEKEIKFKNLALAVVDEQHRFGVKQRAVLKTKSKSKNTPHLLSMSATPIPRTLSLALYGDLDLSVLDEMPPGRQKVATFLVPPEKREAAYQFLEKEIKQGRQIFVICPLIEESDILGVKAATVEYEKLKKIFSEFKVGLLHGKIKTKDKEKVMRDFKDKKFHILVSTAVVEVGVDVPNATVMMIEGAERFGLAQLHQFRGRVGRGEHKSYCLLFTEGGRYDYSRRLQAMTKSNDGFFLAQKDLEIRGPGQLYGIMQHGFLDLKMASLTDFETIKKAQNEAKKIMKKGLYNYPTLISRLKMLEQKRTQ